MDQPDNIVAIFGAVNPSIAPDHPRTERYEQQNRENIGG
jgi:hypothetical protein